MTSTIADSSRLVNGMALALLGVFAFWVLLRYTLVPLLFYFTKKINARPTLEEFFLEGPAIPKDVRLFVDENLAPIEQEGFAVLGAYFLATLVPNVRSFEVLIGKRETKDLATLTVTYVDDRLRGQISHYSVEFRTSFRDGGSVETNNSAHISPLLPVPGHAVNSFPWVRDVRRLYRVHRAIVSRERPDGEAEWPVSDDPRAYLENNLAQTLARQVPVGCLRPRGEGLYGVTFGSAFRISYQGLWPFRPLLERRRRERGEALLRELQV